MKKFVILWLLLIVSVQSLHAQEQRVFDEANLLTDTERLYLEETIDEFIATHNMDFIVVTTHDALGKTSRMFADDYYDENDFGIGPSFDGVLVLIDMDNREIYISTSGMMIEYLSDRRLEAILDEAIKPLGSKQYSQAFYISLNMIKDFVTDGFDYIDEPKQNGLQMPSFDFYRNTAIIVALYVFIKKIVSTRKQYAPLYPEYALNKHFRSKVETLDSTTDLINTTTNRIYNPLPRVKTYSSSGRSRSSSTQRTRATSSRHTSSSGRSHGGSGRKF